MKKITLLILMLISAVSFGQVNINENFNSGTPAGWTDTYFNIATAACEGNSERANLWSSTTTGNLTSPNLLGASNETDLTVSFDYKIVEYNFSNPTVPQGAGWGSAELQYSTDDGANWTTVLTIDDNNHVTSATCANVSEVIAGAILPSGSDVKLRVFNTWVSGDYYFYIDNFVATQVVSDPPSCDATLTETVDVSVSGDISWSAAAGAPNAYDLTVGTTSGGSEILATTDVGNVTSYSLGLLDFATTYYVTIVPKNDNGTAIGCIEQTFVTKEVPAPPMVDVVFDLNACGNSDTYNVAYDASSQQFVWVQLNYAGGCSFVTIDTEGGNFDTEIGLYDSNGFLIGNDDDGGTGSLSSFTDTTLAAGTYYIVASTYNTIYGADDFNVTTTNTTRTGTIFVNASTPSNATADFNNLQFPSEATISSGGTADVYAQVYEPGITDSPGQGAGIEAWIGVSAMDATTSADFATADWTWITATYNTDNGNNDEYQAAIGTGLSIGTYYYVSRFSVNGGPYTYGGINPGASDGNFWDGTNFVSGVLSVTAPGCGDQFFDSGGPNGNYAANENSTTTIFPDQMGDVVTVTFTFVDLETSGFAGQQDGCWDFLTIYDGPDTSSPVLAQTLCGEESGDGGTPSVNSSLLSIGDSFTSTHPSGALTFVFISDSSAQEGGWAADITCAPPCLADAGTLTADASPVTLAGGTATISATPNGDSVVPTDYDVTYVLTSGPTLVIEAAGATPSFDVTEAGDYTIHTLVAETTDATDPNYLDLSVVEFGVTTGGDVLGIVTGAGLCASLDVAGAPITVLEECTADAGTLTADATPVSLSGGTATISATPNGDSVVPTDYDVTYVLTSGPTLVIEAASATPSFNVTEAGDYTIHTLVAETTDATDPNYLDLSVVEFGVTTGGDVLGIVTGAGLCAALDVTGAPIVVDEELGINDNAFANVSVYPNPVKGNVTLRNSRNILIEAINIYDLSGRTVKRLSVNSNATQLNFDLSELATGMYIMIFNSEFGQFERQIIKE